MRCTRSRPQQANDLAVRWNCKAGKCGSCSAEVNGNPRLMCMTRLNQLDLSKPVTVEPMRAFPLDQGSRHRRLVEFPGEEEHQALQAAAAGRAPTAPGGWRRWTSSACRNSASASSASCARTSATCCAIIAMFERVRRPAPSRLRGGARDAPARHREPRPRPEEQRTASATATSRSAAPRSAPRASPSPTTRSFR